MIGRSWGRWFGAPLSAPSVWGKLPSQGDYIVRNATPDDVGAWQRWFDTYPMSALSEAAFDLDGTEPQAIAPGANRWLSTDPVSASGRRHAVPWCFVLPPAALTAARHLPEGLPIIGVMTRSCDKIGRLHPLVVWQSVHPGWLIKHQETQQWLYWLASYVLRHTLPYSTPEAPNPTPFLDLLEALWRTAEPGALCRFGVGPKPLPDGELTRLIAEATPSGVYWVRRNLGNDLFGVSQLPWADWPRVAVTSQGFGVRHGYFWQHGANGDYVGLSMPQIGWHGGLP